MGLGMNTGAGKGDTPRPVDKDKFDANFEAIFGKKKVVRGKFIFDEEKKEFVPADEFVRGGSGATHYVMGDLQPYKSMVTGEMIMGRAQHRDHLRQHNVIEVGNEVKYISQRKEVKPPPGLKRTIAEIVNSRL